MRKTTHIKYACNEMEIWLNKFVKNNSKPFFGVILTNFQSLSMRQGM